MEWKTIRLGHGAEGEERKQEREQEAHIVQREEGRVVMRCAFCRGTGCYAGGGNCFVCSGTGKIMLEEPFRKCVYCHGTGRGEAGTENSCVVCRGRGVISVTEPYSKCSACKGKGKQPSQRWPCVRCAGRGILAESV